MILKFVFALNLIFSLSCFSKSSKFEKKFLAIKKYHKLIDVPISDNVKENTRDNIPARSLKSIENVVDCTSDSWKYSPNCTELPQVHIGREITNVIKEKEITLSNTYSAPIEIFSADSKNGNLNIFSVTAPTMENNIQPKTTVIDGFEQPTEKEKIKSNDGFTEVDIRTTNESQRNREVRAKTEDVQSVLKKIFPEGYFTDNPNSARKGQKSSDLRFLDVTNSRSSKYKVGNSSKRKRKTKKPKNYIFGERVNFRAGEEVTTAPVTGAEQTSPAEPQTNASPVAGAEQTSPAEPQTNASPVTGAEQTSPAEPQTNAAAIAAEKTSTSPAGSETTAPDTTAEQTSPEVSEITTVASNHTPNVNYHYHFHIFGGVSAPTPM